MSFRKEAISGVKWTTFVKVFEFVLQFARIAILARFLEKADFGLLAIVNTVLGFTIIFNDLGLTVAMLHKQDTTQKQYSSIFWFNWILNIVIFIVIAGAAPLIANFYDDQRLVFLIIIMGSGMLIGPIGKITQTIKTKNLEFAFLSKLQVVSKIFNFTLLIVLLLFQLGIYSIVYSTLCTSLLKALVLFISGRKQLKVRFYMNFKEIKDYFRIGMFEQGKQIFDYLAYRIDVILIGRFFGMDNLGIYNLGKELVLKPMKLINPILTSVATPIFAKIQDDDESIKRNYIKILKILTFINFPLLAILFVLADPIIAIVYGENLLEVAYFVKVLSIWGMFASIGNPSGVLSVAKGRTDLSFKWTLIRVIVAPIAIFIASYFTIREVAYSQVILQIIFYWVYWKILIYPLSKIIFLDYVKAVKQSLICVLLAIVAVELFQLVYFNDHIHNLIGGLIVFSITYIGMSFLFNKNIIVILKSLILKPKTK